MEELKLFVPKYSVRNSYIYTIPTPALLKDYTKAYIPLTEELEDVMTSIKNIFKTFQINLIPKSYIVGANVTLFQFEPMAGTKLSKIKGLEDDLALYLGVEGVRILAPIKGKPLIGVEVPNKKSSIVGLKSILLSDEFKSNTMELPIVLGERATGEPFIFDLTRMPHVLMGGSTGMGKSVAINVVLSSLLMSKHPTEMKLVLVDVKKVELSPYEKLNSLFKLDSLDELVLTDIPKILGTMNDLCVEMDKRYDRLKLANCRSITEYNTKFINAELNNDNKHKYMPYIVVIIDEFADLMMSTNKLIEQPITRLAQLGRSAGLHLIIATQRPSVDVVTGLIKANFPTRIAFRVSSKTDSRTIIDANGGEALIGNGDCLFSKGMDLIRVQSAFMSTDEINMLVNKIVKQ